ncbi:hypothetical protein WB66_12345 [bacteria symbiont BFo1 of Frankliniella occidentalis]|nr:hypothetical protein AI28_12340 [bacteria symbiont BFo1 of Frankliniella occidentalis]KYP84489.1 hypothetical protein WB66_12345 [bacteria symbiont BFo1 of Frankliniella occidentalis]
MHNLFSNRRVAGEWFRCEFEDVVSTLKEICPPEFSTGEMRAARAFDQAKGDKIFNAIQAHRSNLIGLSISGAFLSSISRLEEIYAFDNSMLHVCGALSDFLPEFSEPHELMVNAREHLAKSIDLLSKALVGIHSASNGLSIDESETQVSILKGMIDSPTPSDETRMKFEGNGSEWAARQVQERAA